MGWLNINGNWIGRHSGKSWSSYWKTRSITTLKVVSNSTTEQTITATLTGEGYDGVSWEKSIDNSTWEVAGTSATGTYNATGLTVSTKYYWRARLYKGSNYSSYSNTDWDVTFPSLENIGFIFKIKSTSTPVDGGDGFYYTEDLKLRLDSGVYYVHTWYDKSGNGNNAIQIVDASQPVYDHNANEVIFNATSDPFLKVSHDASIDITTGDVSISYKIGKINCANFLMNKGVNTEAQLRFWQGCLLRYYDATPSGQVNVAGGIVADIGDFISLVLDRDTSFTAYKNTSAGTPQAFNHTGSLHTTDDLYIGKLGGAYDTTMAGNVNFICLYAKAYSQADVNELASYTTQMQPEYTIENITYSSTIDAINDLVMRKSTRLDRIDSPIPLLVCMHGWSQDITYLTDNELKIRADRFFTIVVGMRSVNDASGGKDVSGRELHDIYDAVQYCLTNYGTYIDSTRMVIEGQSGGGGNVLGMCCKFPDLFNVTAESAGMSDYGYDDTYSWYITNPAFDAGLDLYIGTPRASKLNEYRSRNAVEAITNYQGYLYMDHADGDLSVDVVHAQRLVTALGAQTNFLYNEISGTGHPANIATAFYTKALTEEEKTIPTSGTFRIIGYMITKRFSIWLDSGISSVADVTYDVETDTYTITPVTAGNIAVVITQGAKTVSATISEATELIVI